MNKEYPIFEWIPGIPITDKYGRPKNKNYIIASTHGDEKDDYFTENGDEGEKKNVTYNQQKKYEYPSDRENCLSGNIIKKEDQTDQKDSNIGFNGAEGWENQKRYNNTNMVMHK